MAWISQVAMRVSASMPALTLSTKPLLALKSKSPWNTACPVGK